MGPCKCKGVEGPLKSGTIDITDKFSALLK